MAEKELGYVELEWECPSCGTRNPGSQRTCAQCGAPHPKDVEFVQAPQEEIITDAEKIAEAEAGPDIHCAYCGARNPATRQTCKQCGADLREGTARASGRVVGALRDQEAAPVICPACGASNPATALKCSQCGSPLARPPEEVPAPAAQPRGCSKWLLLIPLAILGLIALFIFLSSRTSELVGQVTDVRWRRVIAVEALVPVTREGWRTAVPEGAEIGRCRQALHHIQDEPAPGAKEVCGTPYVIDTGSGYGKVVQDCQYEVYAEKCEYQVLEWRPVMPLVLEGHDFNPRWPEASLAANQRIGSRQEELFVIFIAEDREYTYRAASLEEFVRYIPGSRWVLQVNALGNVISVSPR